MKEQTQELGTFLEAEENWNNINTILQLENISPKCREMRTTAPPAWKPQHHKSSSILLCDVSTPKSTPTRTLVSKQDRPSSDVFETPYSPSHQMLHLTDLPEVKDELLTLENKTRSNSIETLEVKRNRMNEYDNADLKLSSYISEVYSIDEDPGMLNEMIKEFETVSNTGSSAHVQNSYASILLNSEESILMMKRKSQKLKLKVSDSRISSCTKIRMSGKSPVKKEIDARTLSDGYLLSNTFDEIILTEPETPLNRSLALSFDDKEFPGSRRYPHNTPPLDEGSFKSNSKSILTNIIKSSGNCVTSLNTFYWESELRQASDRRRCNKKNKRKWGEQNIFRVMKNIEKVGNVMDTKSYYSVFNYSNGRTTPWKEMTISIIWTTIFLGLHKNYWDLIGHVFPFDPWFSYSFFNYFVIALGFLLYMQATACSARWWESRVNWQIIIEKSKMLAVLLNTHLSCLRLSRYGVRLIIAHLICVRNVMQLKYNAIWEEEMLEVLDRKTVDMIMKQPRRLRYFAVLYGFQRLIELCIEYQILPREVIREINPTLTTISTSIGACNRIRETKLPWIIAVHLQFMLIVFIVFLPMTLVGVGRGPDTEFDEFASTKIGWVEIYIYEIVIAYAFFGLSRMAVNISDPFSFSQENHSFGFWGFYEYNSAIEVENLRKIFGFRTNKHGPDGVNADGDYGDKWSSGKLECPIRKALSKELPKTHALHGRRSIIVQQLDLNKRDTAYWENFNQTTSVDDDTSFTFASAPEDENLVVTEQLRRSLKFDRTVVPRRSAIKRISQFRNTLPSFRQSLV